MVPYILLALVISCYNGNTIRKLKVNRINENAEIQGVTLTLGRFQKSAQNSV